MNQTKEELPVAAKTLQVAVYLNVENIVAANPNPDGSLITLKNGAKEFFKFLPLNADGSIEIPLGTQQVTFTLTDWSGRSDGKFWLTRFKNENEGPIAKSAANSGANSIPANVLTIGINPAAQEGDTEDFNIHCYFIYFNEAIGENWVYHCKTDPELKVGQGGG